MQRSDTDRDGIDDFTEVTEGLDPLGGRAIPTGVIATQALNGEAKAVVVEGSTTIAGRLTAFFCDGIEWSSHRGRFAVRQASAVESDSIGR